MATPFDETAYLKNKLTQLQTVGFPSDYKGSPTDTEYLKQYLKAAGFTPEQHYQQFGKLEGVSPFDEEIYLKNKLEELRVTNSFPADYRGSPTDTEALRQYIASKGMTVPQHYEKYGMAEQVSTNSLGYTAADAEKAIGTKAINSLFLQTTGRPATQEELQTWGQRFGSEIDLAEAGLFQRETALLNLTSEQKQRQAEIDAWIKREPVSFQNLYKAIQSGQARIGQVPVVINEDTGETSTQLGVLDASGKPIEGISVDRNTGTIITLTKNGRLLLNTQIGSGGELTPILPENYSNQVKYNSFGNDWDQLPGLVKAVIIAGGGWLAAPYIGAGLASAAPGTLAAGTAANAAATGALLGGGTAALTGQDVLQGALLGGLGGYASNALGGTQASGLGPQTDASFLAADAAQLAAQGLSESQIASTLGASGYATSAAANLAASMATNGLDIGMMTKQLENLSQNTGLMQQNYSQGEFVAYDALGLKGAVGNDFAAIEQNLVASGVDPLVAADISQQIAFNPNITQPELASHLTNTYGNNIYDVDMAATYPTSQLPGAGGLLSDIPLIAPVTTPTTATPPGLETPSAQPPAVETPSPAAPTTPTTPSTPGGTTAGAGAAGASGLTPSQITDLIKAGVTAAVASKATGGSGLFGGGGAPIGIGDIPSQDVPQYSPAYYQALQQYYNAYMPNMPRDVATPLQKWYENKYGA